MTYDSLMRLPFLSWALLIVVAQSAGLLQLLHTPAPIDIAYLIHVAARLSIIAFMSLLAAAVVLRNRPSGKANGVEPRVSALAGTFTIYVIALFPRCELSLSLETISTVLILIGTLGASVVLSQLGRSFSIMAETRELVTSGPYRFVRHPLYLIEEIAGIGVFVQFASRQTAILLAVQIAFQLRRMHNEEKVLTANFPEYATYQQITARLVPGIY